MPTEAGNGVDDQDEEDLIVVDFDCADADSFVKECKSFRIEGLDTPAPKVWLDGTGFESEYLPTIGTSLLFRVEGSVGGGDSSTGSKGPGSPGETRVEGRPKCAFTGKSFKILRIKRKLGDSDQSVQEEQTPHPKKKCRVDAEDGGASGGAAAPKSVGEPAKAPTNGP